MPTLLFVHGLNSDCARTFPNMIIEFREDRDFDGWELLNYDYESLTKTIEDNGLDLRDTLKGLRQAFDGPLTIVAHSMGGLVSRYAALQRIGDAQIVDRIVMLGSPNFAVFRSSELGLLSQLLVGQAKHFGYYMRLPGVMNLLDVPRIFTTAYNDGYKTTETEYVTVPGTYYHATRSDVTLDLSRLPGWQTVFNGVNLFSSLSAAFPILFRFYLEKPHDGIVEEASVNLIPSLPGRWSEKSDSIKATRADLKTYVHVQHRATDELNHIEITNDEEIIALTKDLVMASSVSDWVASSPNPYEITCST